MNEILKDVYIWSVFSEEKKLNFNGYFIHTQHPLFGNVVIDPPSVSDLDLVQMETLGFVQQILITNRNHIRWSRELRRKFDAEIRMNSADEQSDDLISDHNFVDGNSLLHVSTFHFIFHIQNIISNSNCSNINYRGLWVRGDMVAICLCSKKAQKIHQRRCRKKIKARLIEGWGSDF